MGGVILICRCDALDREVRRTYIQAHPGRPISRVLSRAVIYLGRRLPAVSSGLPGAWTGRAAPCPPKWASPLLGLAPGGGCLAVRVATDAGGLLHHLFTITVEQSQMSRAKRAYSTATYFSVALFRRVTPPGCYPAPCPVEPGLSSPRSATGVGARLPGQPGRTSMITRHCVLSRYGRLACCGCFRRSGKACPYHQQRRLFSGYVRRPQRVLENTRLFHK